MIAWWLNMLSWFKDMRFANQSVEPATLLAKLILKDGFSIPLGSCQVAPSARGSQTMSNCSCHRLCLQVLRDRGNTQTLLSVLHVPSPGWMGAFPICATLLVAVSLLLKWLKWWVPQIPHVKVFVADPLLEITRKVAGDSVLLWFNYFDVSAPVQTDVRQTCSHISPSHSCTSMCSVQAASEMAEHRAAWMDWTAAY